MTEALVGLLGMLVLAFLRLPIALAMGLVGVIGYAYMRDWSWSAALAAVQTKVYETGRNYTLSVIPLFILMGSFVTRAGTAADLQAPALAERIEREATMPSDHRTAFVDDVAG